MQRGISDGLMSEIALRAGISRQRLYMYYKNIDEIVFELMNEVIGNSYLARISDAPETDTPENIIRYSILSFQHLSEEVHNDLLFLLLYAVYRATDRNLRASHSPAPILLFEKQIRAGQKAGVFRTDKPLEELTAAGVSCTCRE